MLLPNLPPPVEGIHFQTGDTEAYINQRSLGKGTLYIAESRLSWAKDGQDNGLSLEYPHIAVHAVSRDVQSFPSPCLYLMLDIDIASRDTESSNGVSHSDSEDEGNEDSSEMTEIRFVPSDAFVLEQMYKALNECQVLHPDPETLEDEDLVGEYGHDDNEDEGVYEVHDDFMGPRGPRGYEDDMEEGLGEGQNGNPNDDAMDQDDQFEDAQQ